MSPCDWPELPLAAWADTCATLHLWTQVVGKIRLAHAPMINHWWQVTLYVSGRGLTTSLMHAGRTGLEIEFDLVDHVLDLMHNQTFACGSTLMEAVIAVGVEFALPVKHANFYFPG